MYCDYSLNTHYYITYLLIILCNIYNILKYDLM